VVWHREILLQGRDPTAHRAPGKSRLRSTEKPPQPAARLETSIALPIPSSLHFSFFRWRYCLLGRSVAGPGRLHGGDRGFAWLMAAHRSFGLAGPICVFVFASYPVVLGLQLRQPTLMVAATLAAAYYCVRSERLGLAGILAALSTCKPQLAIAVLLPLSIWSIAQWGARKRFLLAAAGGLGGLLLASELVSRGWITHWMWTLKAYAHYAGSAPPLADLLPGRLVVPGAIILLAAVVGVGCKYRDQDLLYAVSFSIAAFQLLFLFRSTTKFCCCRPPCGWRTMPARSNFADNCTPYFTIAPGSCWRGMGRHHRAFAGEPAGPGGRSDIVATTAADGLALSAGGICDPRLCALPAWNRFPARTRVLGHKN